MPTVNQVHVNRPLSSPRKPVEQAEIDLTPPESVQAAARRGLELRRKWGRGGLSTAEAGEQGIGSGVARATSLANGQKVSPETIGRMVSFFARHSAYKPKHKTNPPNASYISWLLWGGDPGAAWSRKVYDQLQERKKVGKANHSKSHCMLCKDQPPTVDVLWANGQRRAWFCDECYKSWSEGKTITMSNKVEGIVPKRFRKMVHSPKEVKKSMNDKTVKINGVPVPLRDLARAWLSKTAQFTDAPWSDPAPNLSPEQYAKVCLIQMPVEAGKERTKADYKLPVKSTPTGPYNRNALRAAAAALQGARGGVQAPDDQKRTAAQKLVKLMEQAGIEAGDGIKELAGLKVEKGEVWEIPIAKADEERRVVYGVALKPFEADSQKDRIDPAEVEKAAWGFMKYLGKGQGRMDYQHEQILPLDKAYPVESYIAPQDMALGTELVPKGSWVMAVHVPDDKLWQMVKSGQINGFSIRGTGRRTPVTE